ncbi:MAG: pilus assembly protein PilM, partial [Candidatus Babeliales bacterium]
MIKEIFLPEKIGDYYLFSKRIVGIDIGKTHINAVLVYMRGKTITIERCIEEKIENGTAANHDERIIAALRIIFEQIGSYDAVYTTLSSSLVVFKELKLPFLSREKIEMVVNFEVEPLLPFPLQDAVVDFIITKQVPEEKSSEILVAAVQKKHIVHCLEIFGQAKILVDKVIVDFFALYSLYKRIPIYNQLRGSVVLIDFGFQSIRIAYLFDGQLRLIRTINQGISHIAITLSNILHISRSEAMDYIIRFGLEKTDWPEYTQAVTETLTEFWKTVNFTFSSFIVQTPESSINKIFLLGDGGQIKGLSSFISTLLQVSVEIFDSGLIIQDKEIKLASKHMIANTCTTALSVALPSPIIKYFNFRRNEFQIVDHTLLIKQLIMTFLLTSVLVIMLFSFYIMQIKKLSREVYDSE